MSRPVNGASSVSLRFRPPRSATTRIARYAGTGLALPFRSWSPAGSNAIALDAVRSVASSTRTVPGGATDWRRLAVLTRSPATIPWLRGAEGDGGLAGQDAGACAERRFETGHPVDELEGGPDRALGVILVRGRGAPDRHHGVADELLDGAAVAGDDVAGGLEVAGQEVARLLRDPSRRRASCSRRDRRTGRRRGGAPPGRRAPRLT